MKTIFSLEFYLGLFFAIEASFLTIIAPRTLDRFTALMSSINNKIDEKQLVNHPLLNNLIKKANKKILSYESWNYFLNILTRVVLFGGAAAISTLFYFDFCFDIFSEQGRLYITHTLIPLFASYVWLKLIYYTRQYIYCGKQIKALGLMLGFAECCSDKITKITLKK